MPAANFDVITLGLVAVDVLVLLPEHVHKDDKQFVTDLIIQGGAPTGSAACGVARLGYSTAVVVRLGENTLSDIARDQFRRHGVSLDLAAKDAESRPAIALVEIDALTAARTVFINLDNYGYVHPEDIPRDAIRKARALLVDGYDLDASERALEAAQGSKCRTVLDLESGDAGRLKKLLKLGTDAILPLACARRLSGEEDPAQALKALSKITAAQLVTTDGLHGSWALQEGQVIHQPAFPVKAVDSTGCGDAYHAGYIAGLLEGWDLPTRMEFASWLASLVATRVGGRTALPKRGEMRGHLRPEISPKLKTIVQRIGL
jgi:sulfofructose kinase